MIVVGSRETNDGSRDAEGDELRNCSEPMRGILFLDQSEDESIFIIKIISIFLILKFK